MCFFYVFHSVTVVNAILPPVRTRTNVSPAFADNPSRYRVIYSLLFHATLEVYAMKDRHPIALMFFLASLFLAPVSIQADGLNAEHKQMMEQRLSKMSADEVDHVRQNPRARLQFLRSLASSMTPQQRELFRDSWKSMSAEERQQALNVL